MMLCFINKSLLQNGLNDYKKEKLLTSLLNALVSGTIPTHLSGQVSSNSAAKQSTV